MKPSPFEQIVKAQLTVAALSTLIANASGVELLAVAAYQKDNATRHTFRISLSGRLVSRETEPDI